MKYEKPNMSIIDLSDDIIVTSYLDVVPGEGGGNEDPIVIPKV